MGGSAFSKCLLLVRLCSLIMRSITNYYNSINYQNRARASLGRGKITQKTCLHVPQMHSALDPPQTMIQIHSLALQKKGDHSDIDSPILSKSHYTLLAFLTGGSFLTKQHTCIKQGMNEHHPSSRAAGGRRGNVSREGAVGSQLLSLAMKSHGCS